MKRSFLYLSEFHVGDKFTTLSRTVTETDVVPFRKERVKVTTFVF